MKKNMLILTILFILVIIIGIISLYVYKKNNIEVYTNNIETYTEININNSVTDVNKNEMLVIYLNSENEEENNIIENNEEEVIKVENKNKENKSKKTETKKISSNKYYIKVNYGANVVTIYSKDNDGNYTIPVKAMICSTGTATPKSGKYSIKLRWEWLGLFRKCIWTLCYTN